METKTCIADCCLENTGFNYTMSLIPILDSMCDWGYRHREAQNDEQKECLI